MTYEASEPIALYGTNKGEVKKYNCADSNAIAKGALLFLVDPYTVSGAALVNTPAAGICSNAKEAGDGQTTISVWTKGRFDLRFAGASASNIVSAGDLLKISGLNIVTLATADNMISGMIIARAVETSDSANETISADLVMI